MIGTILLLACAATAERQVISGAVFDAMDAPVDDATVYVYTARPRTGAGDLCPSCYADCAKYSQTGADGSFRLENVDPTLVFNLLVVKRNYAPCLVEQVDPESGPAKAKLSRMDPARLAPEYSVRGRVVDTDGEPIRTAIVEPVWVTVDERHFGSPEKDMDALAATDERGEFVITSGTKLQSVKLRIAARGYAIAAGPSLESGEPQADIILVRGASVSGTLMRDGSPLGSVSLGLITQRRGSECSLPPLATTTDAAGHFTFYNVAPGTDYYIYGLMDSFGARGALPVSAVTYLVDGKAKDLGVLNAEQGHRVRGKLATSDGKPVPAETRVCVSRENASDSLNVAVEKDGTFTLEGLPSESYTIFVRTQGYVLSDKNASCTGSLPSLSGLVTRDIDDLVVLLEPGDPTVARKTALYRPELQGKLIAGVSP